MVWNMQTTVLENLLVGLFNNSGSSIIRISISISGAVRSQVILVILLDCVSKKYPVLLPIICSDIFCFPCPYKSGPCIAICFLWQLTFCTRSSLRFLIFLLVMFYTVFLIFHCHLSVLISQLFHTIWDMHCMSKIFQFADCGQSIHRVLGHNLFSPWCIRPSYSPWYHQSFPYLLSFTPIQHWWKECCLQ